PEIVDVTRRDAFDDDDGPGRAVRVRPTRQRARGVKDVLNAVDQDRRLRPVGESEHALEAQEPRPQHRADQRQEFCEGARIDGFGAAESKALDAVPRTLAASTMPWPVERRASSTPYGVVPLPRA